MKTPAKTNVPVPATGQAQRAEVEVQADLAERTLQKLYVILEVNRTEVDEAAAQETLTAAFREAHCDETLQGVFFWDLGNNSRIVAGETTIPTPELPTVGTILTWAGKTY